MYIPVRAPYISVPCYHVVPLHASSSQVFPFNFPLSRPCSLLCCVNAGDHSGLFSAVIAIRTKLVEGTSAPFDLPVRRQGGAGGGGAGGGGGGGGGAEHNHGHSHGHVDDEDSPYNQNGQVALHHSNLCSPGLCCRSVSVPAAVSSASMIIWLYDKAYSFSTYKRLCASFVKLACVSAGAPLYVSAPVTARSWMVCTWPPYACSRCQMQS